MRIGIILVLVAALGCCLAGVNLQNLFGRYSGADHIMVEDEMANYWKHFDSNSDGQVSKGEFDHVWKREDLGDEDRIVLYFIELDRVADEVLDDQDYPHIFRLFDENGDGSVTYQEFKFNWEGLFKD